MSEMGFKMFNTGVNLFETFLQLWYVTRYLGYQEKISHPRKHFVITWVLLFLQIQILNSITLFEGIMVLLNPVILIIYAFLFLNGKWIEKIFVSVSTLMCTALINSFVAALQTIIWKEHINETILDRSYKYIVMLVLTKILLVIVFQVILTIKSKLTGWMENRLWFLFLIILISSVVSVFFIYLTIERGCKSMLYIYYLICAILGIVVMNVITFYFLKRISKETELKQEIELLQHDIFYQQENIRNILQEQEKVRRLKHDMKRVIMGIQLLANKEDSESIASYCANYVGEIGSENNIVYTGISTIDNLLIYKLTIAENHGIHVKVEASNINLEHISDIHMCIILGNLLDNAIEALEKVKQKKKLLHIIIEQEPDSYINIFIKNTVQEVMTDTNPQLVTTKPDKEMHGFGIRNVKEIVKQYEGMVDFYHTDDIFTCHIQI